MEVGSETSLIESKGDNINRFTITGVRNLNLLPAVITVFPRARIVFK